MQTAGKTRGIEKCGLSKAERKRKESPTTGRRKRRLPEWPERQTPSTKSVVRWCLSGGISLNLISENSTGRPAEVSAEEANKIGYETVMRFTHGEHAFIVVDAYR